VDVENRDKVFKFYTDNIVVPKITAVCSICHDDFRNDSRKSDKDWEVYLRERWLDESSQETSHESA